MIVPLSINIICVYIYIKQEYGYGTKQENLLLRSNQIITIYLHQLSQNKECYLITESKTI